VDGNEKREAVQLLDRLEVTYGASKGLRRRLLPIVAKILESSPPSKKREALLRLVIEAYAHHTKVRETIQVLRLRLRERLNEVYSDMLGIEPPRVGY